MTTLPVTVPEPTSTISSRPHTVAAVVWPAQSLFAPGVPATYRLEPLRKAVVAASTGIVCVIVSVERSKMATLACTPPHCGPQLRTYAVDPLIIASTGRSNPGTIVHTAFGGGFVGSTQLTS